MISNLFLNNNASKFVYELKFIFYKLSLTYYINLLHYDAISKIFFFLLRCRYEAD